MARAAQTEEPIDSNRIMAGSSISQWVQAFDALDPSDDAIPVFVMKATSISDAKLEIKTILTAFQHRRTVVRIEVDSDFIQMKTQCILSI